MIIMEHIIPLPSQPGTTPDQPPVTVQEILLAPVRRYPKGQSKVARPRYELFKESTRRWGERISSGLHCIGVHEGGVPDQVAAR